MDAEEKKEMAKIAYKQAYDYDISFGCCPQCVLAAVQDVLDEDVISDDVIKAAHALAGGGGLLVDGTCGAISGGLMAIGALYGREREQFGKFRSMKSYVLGKKLITKFRKEYGGITCKHIQEKYTGRTWDMWDINEYKQFSSTTCKKECAILSAKVASWIVEML